MTTRSARLFQDKSLIANVNGTVSGKGKNSRVGERKPLGDLSNAGKLTNQVVGKKALDGSLNSGKSSVGLIPKEIQSKKNPTIFINDEAASAKAKNLESSKTIANKNASDKSRSTSRKALSDISNSRKPNAPPVIKNKNSLKPSSLIEEPLHPSSIAEEQFLHNHQECIKSQFEAVDVHHFFKIVGLENDSDDHMAISFELPAVSKMKSKSAHFELEEIPEQLPELQHSAEHGSPAFCKTPSLSSSFANFAAVNFKLIETPKLSKC